MAVSGSVSGLAPVEVTAPAEFSGASGHVSVGGARALTARGQTTIIVAALIHSPAPPLVAHLCGVPTPLVDAHQTANGGPLPTMPACKLSRDGTAQPILEAAARASFCRTWSSSERDHCRRDQ